MAREAQVYIHIPFSARGDEAGARAGLAGSSHEERAAYLDALEAEMRATAASLEGTRVTSVLVGGPAPSMMSPDRLGKMVREFVRSVDVAEHLDVEMRALPQTVCTASLTGLGMGRFTRFTMPFGSCRDDELKAAACGFMFEDVSAAILFFQQFGFKDLDFELFAGLPGQDERSWARTLSMACDNGPRHVTLAAPAAPGQEEGWAERAAGLYAQAGAYLAKRGYHRYAAGRFALPREESAFQLQRLRGTDCVGLGLGARSFVDGVSYRNTGVLSEYLSAQGDFERLVRDPVAADEDSARRRLFYLGVQLEGGVPAEGSEDEAARLEKAGLATLDAGVCALTDLGAVRLDEVARLVDGR